MPKIKLSSLISDIKGKANGSVFARNSGGLYFRNNPSGGGKKSSKWSAVKSKFSSLAGKWRALSPQQRQSWNESVNNFNTVNAFGDARIPSGYELFIRMNQPLYNLNRPINEVAPLPESLPPIGDMILTTVDAFLFQPLHGYAPFGYIPPNVANPSIPSICSVPSDPLESDCYIPGAVPIIEEVKNFNNRKGITFSTLVTLNSLSDVGDAVDGLIPLSTTTAGTPELFFAFAKDEFAPWVFRSGFLIGSDRCTFHSAGIEPILDRPFRVTFTVDLSGSEESYLYIDGKPIEMQIIVINDAPAGLNDLPFGILPKHMNKVSPSVIQHTYLSNEFSPPSQLGKIDAGYIVGDPVVLMDYVLQPNGKFINYGSAALNPLGVPTLMKDKSKSFPKINYDIIPWIATFSPTPGVVNNELIIDSSAMGSPGKSGAGSAYKRLGVKPNEGKHLVEIGREFMSQFGVIINNSTIQAQVQILNSISGQLSSKYKIDFVRGPQGLGPGETRNCDESHACDEGYFCYDNWCIKDTDSGSPEAAVAKEKVKFKAGSELASSVN